MPDCTTAVTVADALRPAASELSVLAAWAVDSIAAAVAVVVVGIWM